MIKRILLIYRIPLFTLVLVLISLVLFLALDFDDKLFLGALGVIITLYFGLIKVQIENDRFFKELFIDFNHRYSLLNETLYDITTSDLKVEDLSFKQKDKVYDYFNLCAEEYYWYKKNRINKVVWQSWKNGMFYWFEKDIIKEMWQNEMKNAESKASYYMKSSDNFFHD